MNTIITKILHQQMQSTSEINGDWNYLLNHDLTSKSLLKDSGVNPDGLDIYGRFSSEYDEEKFNSSVIQFLKDSLEEDRPVNSLLYLVGIIGMDEAVPVLLETLKAKKYTSSFQFSYDIECALNSLIMLGVPSIELLPHIQRYSHTNDSFRYLHFHLLMNTHDPANYNQAFELYQSIDPFSECRGRAYKYLPLIAKEGIDTSVELYRDLTHFKSWKKYHTSEIIEWYKIEHSRQVTDRIFHGYDLKTMGFYILCTALENPEEWAFLKEILTDRIDSWEEQFSYGDEDIEEELLMAARILLCIFGEDESEFLSDLYCDKSRNYLTLYDDIEGEEYFEEEEYLDFTVLMEQCTLLFTQCLKKETTPYHQFILRKKLQKFENDKYSQILQSILYYLKREDFIPEYWLTKQLERECSIHHLTNLAGRYPREIRNIIIGEKKSWHRTAAGNRIYYSEFEKNCFSLALLIDDSIFDDYLKEAFIKEPVFETGEAILYIMAYRGLRHHSIPAIAKEKLHKYSISEKSINRQEFDSIYPLVFKNETCETYKRTLLYSATKILESDSELTLQLLRFGPGDDWFVDMILPYVQSVEKEKLTEIIQDCLNGVFDPSIFTVLQAHGMTDEFFPALLEGCREEKINGFEAMEIIEDFLEYSLQFVEVTIDVLEVVSELLPHSEIVPFFNKWIDDYGISDIREGIVQSFIPDHPDLAYLPVCRKLSDRKYNMDESDIRNAVEAIVDSGVVLPKRELTIQIGEEGDNLTVKADKWEYDLDDEAQSTHFSTAESLIKHLLDKYFIPEYLDTAAPEKIWIEIYENDERVDLYTFCLFHDDLADFCSRHSEEEIEEEIDRLIQNTCKWGERVLYNVLPGVCF